MIGDMNQAEIVSRALSEIKKSSDTQPLLHLITLIPSHTAHLLTLSPSLSEVFTWWERGPGLHAQSGACFNLLSCLFRDVLQSHPQLLTQIISIGRRVVKERLHCVYQAISKYSSTPSRRHCLEFLTLLNCLGGSTTRVLLDDFNFGNASLKQMLANPGPVHEKSVQFMLSFLCVPVLELKLQFMGMKNSLRNMTNLLNRNSVNLKIELLTVLTEHVLAGNKIPKKLKCQFFVIPSLVKLSQLWADESAQVQTLTGEFFMKLFDKRCGILFDCPPGDLYSGVSRNPILLSLLKNTSVRSAGYQDFLVDMVRACPEVFPLLIQEKLPSLYSEGSLCRLLGARDVGQLLSNVPDHITDRQIADHIVPKRVSDLLEKELKAASGDRVKVRAALLPLIQSAASVVQSLHTRTRIREYVMYNLCDVTVLQSMLDTTIALYYFRVDRYCLSSGVKSLFQSCYELSDDEHRLLLELCPSMLADFVKHHRDLVSTAVMKHGPVSEALMQRILSAGLYVTSPQQRKLILVICSLVLDDYSDFVYRERRLTADSLAGERLCLVRHLLSNVTDIDRLMQEFISSGGSHSGLMGCKESVLSVILLTSYRYRQDDKLQYKGSIHRVLDTQSPAYLIGSHLLSNREQFTSLGVDKSDVTSLEKYCRIFAHMTCDTSTDSGMLNQFLHVFDGGVMDLMSSNADNCATVISLLSDIVTTLLEQGYRFTDMEALRCVVLSQWVKHAVKVVNSVSCDDTVDDTTFLDTVRCHIATVTEFSRTHRFTVTYQRRLHHVLNLLGDTPLNTPSVTWLMAVSDAFARDIVMHMPRDKQFSLHMLLRNDTRDDTLVSARVTWLSLLEEMLTGVSDHALFGLDQSELDIGVLKHFTVSPEELDRISDPQILHNVLPRCILTSETAPSLIEQAIGLPCPQFFISRHFLNSEHFSACAKSKKTLKDIFVVLVGNGDLGMFATFLTRHVSLYEDNLPVFVRKQIDSCFSDTILEIQGNAGSCKKMEMFILLLSVFLDLVKDDQLERAFSRLFNLSEVQKLLTSDEESHGRDVLVKLMSLLVESQRIPQLTSSHYSVIQRAYQATTSAADRKLSAILKHLDSIGVRSQYPFGHSVYMDELHDMRSVSSHSEHCIKILENLEEEKMTSLINNFPLAQDECGVVSYDVQYLLSLLLYILNKCEIDVRIILSSPIARVALLSLSCHDDVTRRAGYDVIDKLSYKVDDEKFKDKSMCVYLFHMIRNSVLNENERLPHLSTYFLGVFLQTLLCPQKHTYPAVCHFLLQRPVFDFGDVPMFYSMFCSSSQRYQQEQNWLLGILVHAVRDEVDHKILARRHVLSLCFSQKYCHVVANSTVQLIDKLLEKVSTIKSAKVKRDMLESGLSWHLITS